jgi:uncharacterized low-complexity protein
MKKLNKTLLFAVGTTLVSGLTTVAAQTNPFAMTELTSGYMQLAEAAKTTPTDAKAKAPEAKCAGDHPITGPNKTAEAKCGEGKCGSDMKKSADTAKATDATKATDTTKANEGKCGEGKCGAAMKKAAETKPAPEKPAPKK